MGLVSRRTPLPILMLMHFDKGCEISVMLREKRLLLSIATWREGMTVTHRF